MKDCTLDKLHEHIQTAMGWTNSHLHHFKVGEQLYGDPLLVQENFEDMEYEDSTATKLSAILPRSGRRFRLDRYAVADKGQQESFVVRLAQAQVLEPQVHEAWVQEGQVRWHLREAGAGGPLMSSSRTASLKWLMDSR